MDAAKINMVVTVFVIKSIRSTNVQGSIPHNKKKTELMSSNIYLWLISNSVISAIKCSAYVLMYTQKYISNFVNFTVRIPTPCVEVFLLTNRLRLFIRRLLCVMYCIGMRVRCGFVVICASVSGCAPARSERVRALGGRRRSVARSAAVYGP